MFGVSSSPFLLKATLDYHLRHSLSVNPQLVSLLLRSVYVDDVVTGAVDVESALKLYEESRKMLKGGGFNLRKFRTNATQLQNTFDAAEQCEPNSTNASTTSTQLEESDETYAKSTLGGVQAACPSEQKVLGVK